MAHHVFITGGGTGIGLATARALAPTGARFTLVGRDGARAQSAAEEFENAQGLSCDVANEDSVAAAFAAGRDRYGPVDILINNAGITPSAPLDRMDISMWNQCLAINLTGAFLCSRAAITDMYANKWGRIVNAICPGYVETDIVTRAAENIASKTRLSEDEAKASLYAKNPQGRLITADEVASAIAWLCSDGAAATNGAAIPMSGGEV